MNPNISVFSYPEETETVLGSLDEWEYFASWAAKQKGELARVATDGTTDKYRGAKAIQELREKFCETSLPQATSGVGYRLCRALKNPDIQGLIISESESSEEPAAIYSACRPSCSGPSCTCGTCNVTRYAHPTNAADSVVHGPLFFAVGGAGDVVPYAQQKEVADMSPAMIRGGISGAPVPSSPAPRQPEDEIIKAQAFAYAAEHRVPYGQALAEVKKRRKMEANPGGGDMDEDSAAEFMADQRLAPKLDQQSMKESLGMQKKDPELSPRKAAALARMGRTAATYEVPVRYNALEGGVTPGEAGEEWTRDPRSGAIKPKHRSAVPDGGKDAGETTFASRFAGVCCDLARQHRQRYGAQAEPVAATPMSQTIAGIAQGHGVSKLAASRALDMVQKNQAGSIAEALQKQQDNGTGRYPNLQENESSR